MTETWTAEQLRNYMATGNKPTPKKPSKYKNEKVDTKDGKFDSKKEHAYYGKLQMRERAGEISDIQKQVKFKCEVNGMLICNYIADFTYVENGKLVVCDVKSEMTKKLPVYRLKKKLMRAIHNIDIFEA